MSACAGDTRIVPSPGCSKSTKGECDTCGAPLCDTHTYCDEGGVRLYCAGCYADAYAEAGFVAVNCDEKVPVVSWQGFDDSDRPKRRHKANAAFIAAARTLAPVVAEWVQGQGGVR